MLLHDTIGLPDGADIPYTEEKVPPGGFFSFCISNHDVYMNLGLEPILQDLEKLFLLPDEGNLKNPKEKAEIYEMLS